MAVIPGNGKISFERKAGSLILNITDVISVSDGGTVKLGFKPNDVIKIVGKDIVAYVGFETSGVIKYIKAPFGIQINDEGVVFVSSVVEIDGAHYIIGIGSNYVDNSDEWTIELSEV